MELFAKILLLILAGFFLWRLIKMIKGNPQLFTKKAFSESARTLGFIALFLIVVIGFCVLMLR